MVYTLSSRCKFAFASFFGVAALLAPAPSQATIVGCAGQNTASFTWGEIKSIVGFSCVVGDKTYSNFSYASTLNYFNGNPSSGINDADSFALSTLGTGGLIHNLNIQSIGDYNNAQVRLKYDVAVSSGPNVLSAFSGNITGDNLASWGLSVAATSAGSASTTPGFPGLGQSATTPNIAFNPNTLSTTFDNEILVGSSSVGVTQFSNRLTQGVPGPLPILGAGAVLGISRKLRRRVKLSA